VLNVTFAPDRLFGDEACSCPQDVVFTSNDYLKIKNGDPTLTARHPKLVEYIRRRLIAPSKLRVSPFNANRTDHSQVGQSVFVDDLLRHKRGGFHVEVGAADGETMSNTLFFERERNWSGLLIEANPVFYDSMLKRNRHAYSIHACLSPNNRTQAMAFNPAGFIGGLAEMMDDAHKEVSVASCMYGNKNKTPIDVSGREEARRQGRRCRNDTVLPNHFHPTCSWAP
jgi:hypothetical protein